MDDDGDISIRELYEALEERDRHIDELEAVLLAQEDENEKSRNELSDQQKQVSQLFLKNDSLLKEKTQLEDQVRTLNTQLDEQKDIIASASKSSEDAKKIQKDGHKQLYSLELENQRLRATIADIEENEDILVAEIDTLVREKSDFQQQSEELSSKCDLLSANADDKERVMNQLLQEKEKAENDLATHTEEFRRAVEEWQRKDTSSSSEIARLLVELEQERAKCKENAHVKENDSLRTDLIRLRKENKKLSSLYDQCLHDKNQAEQDLDSAIQSLNQSKRDAKDQIAAGLQKLKLVEIEAHTKCDALQIKLNNAASISLDAQEKVDDLRKQLERSDARNSLYEQNMGLSEIIRDQKQLEEDVRRRDYDIKRLNHDLGVEKEKCRVLTKLRDWLKNKANLGPDFTFEDPDMILALNCEEYRLQSENAELTRQIESLEGERTKLLLQLRERSIDIGEKGGRFLGMNPEQISQVLEFASSIRRGVVELPLNDRSKDLLSEITRLKSEREVDKATIIGLEREVAAREPIAGERSILKQVLDNMVVENQKFRDELMAVCVVARKSPRENLDNSRKETLSEHESLRQRRAADYDATNGENKSSTYDHLLRPKPLKFIKNVCADGVESALPEITETKSLETIVANITNERDFLFSQVCKMAEEYNKGTVQLDAITELVTLKVQYNALQEELKEEKEARRNDQQCLDASRKRIFLLEKGKLNAFSTMDEQKVMVNLTANCTSGDRFDMVRDPLQPKVEDASTLTKTGDEGRQKEINVIYHLLSETNAKLAGFAGDIKALHVVTMSLQETRIDSSRAVAHIRCLDEIIDEKNRAIQEGKNKIAQLKKRTSHHLQPGIHFNRRSEHTTITNSIDEANALVADNAGQESNMFDIHATQSYNEETSKLLIEKENIICEQNHKIMELKQKVLQADVNYQKLTSEAQSMKTDISTLVSRLSEAESAVNEISAYQKKLDETQESLNKAKEEIESLRKKVGVLSTEREKQDAKIKYLVATDTRTKTILSVTRQGKARIEVNLKAATEEIASLKESAEKMGAQMSALKAEKIEAQNEKLKLSRKARDSANKLKDLTDECIQKGSTKAVEDLTKRVEVLNKTVSGLASQNSSLRCELAACKAKKKAEEEAATAAAARPMSDRRASVSKERPISSSSRVDSLEDQAKALKEQVSTLNKSLAEEKSKHASNKSSMEEKYQKQIHELEKKLQSTMKLLQPPREIASESEDLRREQELSLSLTDEINSLKQRIKKATSDADVQLRRMKAENDALRKENDRLSQVDHIDFFEEIENLKSKYNEAVRQINQLTTTHK